MPVHSNLGGGISKAKATAELSAALLYSGLITPDMTFEEMCDVLAAEYPEFDGIFYDAGDQRTQVTDGWVGYGTYQFSTANAWTRGNSYIQPNHTVLCPSKFKFLNVELSATVDVDAHQYWAGGSCFLSLLNQSNTTVATVTLNSHGTNGEDMPQYTISGVYRLAIPSNCLGTQLKPRIGTSITSDIVFSQITITKVWLTAT